MIDIAQASRTRAEINRENAKKSTGPRTAEGKVRSAMNACIHGMTGQVTIMPGEDREAHDRFCAGIVAGYAPEGALELQVAQSIAETEWRLNRASAIEQNIFAAGIDGPEGDIDTDHPQIQAAAAMAEVFLRKQRAFSNLTLYESRLHRAIQRSEARLRTLQAEREKATEAAAIKTEVLVAHAAGSGIDYDPGSDFPPSRGFVFSNEEVARIIDRRNRLDAAWKYRIDSRKAKEDEELDDEPGQDAA